MGRASKLKAERKRLNNPDRLATAFIDRVLERAGSLITAAPGTEATIIEETGNFDFVVMAVGALRSDPKFAVLDVEPYEGAIHPSVNQCVLVLRRRRARA